LRDYWFAQLLDNTGVDKVPIVEITLADNKTILDFIRKFAKASCACVKKIESSILNNTISKDIFTELKQIKKGERKMTKKKKPKKPKKPKY